MVVQIVSLNLTFSMSLIFSTTKTRRRAVYRVLYRYLYLSENLSCVRVIKCADGDIGIQWCT